MRSLDGVSVVYFAQAARGLVSIGVTDNVSAVPDVLGHMPGGRVEAMAIRQRFAHLALGEHFRAVTELTNFIAEKCARPEVSPPSFEFPRITQRQVSRVVRFLRTFARRRAG
jgi:hypothetical protein